MPPGEGGVPTRRLREAVAAELERRSFRAVAKAVGVSPMGLHRLLQGSEPQLRTRRKLETWFVQQLAASEEGLDPDAARAALQLLLQDLSPEKREKVFRQALEFWAGVYQAEMGTRPDWLRKLGGTP